MTDASPPPPRARRRYGAVEVGFVVVFGLITALQVWSLVVDVPAIDRAAGIARVVLLPLVMLMIGIGVARSRRARDGSAT